MGIMTALRARREQVAVTAALSIATDPTTLPIASPWASSDLQRIVFKDIFGTDVPENTRAAAMRLPAIARGRNLIVSSIARLPLGAANDAGPLPTPAWMTSCSDGSSPQIRLAMTVDDLIFYGWSCWWRVNDPVTGFPVDAGRLNQDEWSINVDNQIVVRGTPAKPGEVILIPGFHEGILSFGVDAIKDARSLYVMVRKRLKNPLMLDLHQTGGADLTDDEIDALILRFAVGREGENGGIGFTSKNIEAKEMGKETDSQLLIEARNAASLDLARLVGVHAGMIDATAPKASLNYETSTGRNQEFNDLDLALYTTPITARLSLDDLLPKGDHAVLDLADFTGPAPSPTGPVLED